MYFDCMIAFYLLYKNMGLSNNVCVILCPLLIYCCFFPLSDIRETLKVQICSDVLPQREPCQVFQHLYAEPR